MVIQGSALPALLKEENQMWPFAFNWDQASGCSMQQLVANAGFHHTLVFLWCAYWVTCWNYISNVYRKIVWISLSLMSSCADDELFPVFSVLLCAECILFMLFAFKNSICDLCQPLLTWGKSLVTVHARLLLWWRLKGRDLGFCSYTLNVRYTCIVFHVCYLSSRIYTSCPSNTISSIFNIFLRFFYKINNN